MQVLMNLVLVLQLIAALAMIGLVLVQHGKGADMGASFGSGASGSLFGATGSANFLSRSTAIAATIFFVCTLALAYMSSHRESGLGGSTAAERLLEQGAAPALPASAAAPAASSADVVPGAALSPVAPASAASN
ncbi:preprotein translocase subunit SecG [Roseateles terrae]|jgi:preprotein translocase subunit SecG|uniref:Protein-export membrane protein SecG n=1 Tax=Roseateles terrae TaxID=431060 RepID=A0ABR6GPF1_9BURK|nr:preprotein translocase subunit SecG [Roseateles terrae]MBB3193572.1 preprotein translocase subunit SecG [Roseateles terrae]OWQ89260.1 preprotein translocase subunit SecG [Roseateles terrae]